MIQFIKKTWFISYDELERICFGPVQQIIAIAASKRTPASLTVDTSTVIYRAMENVDHFYIMLH